MSSEYERGMQISVLGRLVVVLGSLVYCRAAWNWYVYIGIRCMYFVMRYILYDEICPKSGMKDNFLSEV